MPPADAVLVPKLTLRMSHRMWWLLAEALKFGESAVGFDASIAEAGVPFSHPRARLISATLASPALKVRVFIVFLLLRVPPTASVQSMSTRLFRCTGGARAAHRWKSLRDPMGVGRTARTGMNTDSGVEPAGRIAARRTAVTLGDLERVNTPGPHTTAAKNVPAPRHGARSVPVRDLRFREEVRLLVS